MMYFELVFSIGILMTMQVVLSIWILKEDVILRKHQYQIFKNKFHPMTTRPLLYTNAIKQWGRLSTEKKNTKNQFFILAF